MISQPPERKHYPLCKSRSGQPSNLTGVGSNSIIKNPRNRHSTKPTSQWVQLSRPSIDEYRKLPWYAETPTNPPLTEPIVPRAQCVNPSKEAMPGSELTSTRTPDSVGSIANTHVVQAIDSASWGAGRCSHASLSSLPESKSCCMHPSGQPLDCVAPSTKMGSIECAAFAGRSSAPFPSGHRSQELSAGSSGTHKQECPTHIHVRVDWDPNDKVYDQVSIAYDKGLEADVLYTTPQSIATPFPLDSPTTADNDGPALYDTVLVPTPLASDDQFYDTVAQSLLGGKRDWDWMVRL